jgi:hypothetical protein
MVTKGMTPSKYFNSDAEASMSSDGHFGRTVFFHRDFRGFTGGHLKVWDYFNHVSSSAHHKPRINFSKETLWDETNPWLGLREQSQEAFKAGPGDILFLAGMDWLSLTANQRQKSTTPIINLVQGIKHSDPADIRSSFLKYKAVRICVSQPIREAIESSHKVNGPLYVIPNGIDRTLIPSPSNLLDRPVDVLLAALKQPHLGRHLAAMLQRPGRTVKLLNSKLPRTDFLHCLSQAKLTIFLPKQQEGFYLPALEGMAAGTLVVCPDCVGNRSFCVTGQNSFVPRYTITGILDAAETVLQLSSTMTQQILINATHTAAVHDLLKERQTFLKLLDNIELLW